MRAAPVSQATGSFAMVARTPWQPLVAGVLTFTDTGLQPNTAYSYVVRAFDGRWQCVRGIEHGVRHHTPGHDSAFSADQCRRDRADFDLSARQLECIDGHWGIRVSGLPHLSKRRVAERRCSQRDDVYGRDRNAQYGLRLPGLGNR